MNEKHVLCLGLGLVVGSSLAFVISWFAIARFKNPVQFSVERIWLRSLAVCFYVGLTILLATAVGSVVQITWKGIR
jgi:hypothetical protein